MYVDIDINIDFYVLDCHMWYFRMLASVLVSCNWQMTHRSETVEHMNNERPMVQLEGRIATLHPCQLSSRGTCLVLSSFWRLLNPSQAARALLAVLDIVNAEARRMKTKVKNFVHWLAQHTLQ